MQLRPFQNDIYHQVVNLIKKGRRRILIVSVTGSGKTVMASHFLKQAFSKGNSAMFNCHRIELVHQSASTFFQAGFPFGVVSPQHKEEYEKIIQVSSIQTLSRRLKNLKHAPKVIIWDECHHLAAANWSYLFHNFPNAVHIGLTATPQRLDGKGLKDFFEEMILGPSMKELISEGYLTDYKVKSTPNKVDYTGVKKRMGDYIATDLASVFDNPAIRGDALKQWLKHAQGQKTIGFSTNVEHSKNLTDTFSAAGFKAEHIDGGSDKGHRSSAINRYKTGATSLLFNVDLFGEGFDVPATQAIMQIRKTASLGLHLQQVGRVLRPSYHPGYTKDDLLIRDLRLKAIADSDKPYGTIIDMVQNYKDHGFADDDREWSLEGKKQSEKNVMKKECPECYHVNEGNVRTCEECGYVFVIAKERAGANLLATDEDLIEINVERERQQKKNEQFLAQSKEDLIKIGRQRGYKNPARWAQYVLDGREQKKNRTASSGN
jgi:DNA repair protein RadD